MALIPVWQNLELIRVDNPCPDPCLCWLPWCRRCCRRWSPDVCEKR